MSKYTKWSWTFYHNVVVVYNYKESVSLDAAITYCNSNSITKKKIKRKQKEIK